MCCDYWPCCARQLHYVWSQVLKIYLVLFCHNETLLSVTLPMARAQNCMPVASPAVLVPELVAILTTGWVVKKYQSSPTQPQYNHYLFILHACICRATRGILHLHIPSLSMTVACGSRSNTKIQYAPSQRCNIPSTVEAT